MTTKIQQIAQKKKLDKPEQMWYNKRLPYALALVVGARRSAARRFVLMHTIASLSIGKVHKLELPAAPEIVQSAIVQFAQ